jgi:hypothetical protein
MYIMGERLNRPMKRMYGGKWISMTAIPPLTPLFLYLVMVNLQLDKLTRFYGTRRWVMVVAAVIVPVFIILAIIRQIVRFFKWLF